MVEMAAAGRFMFRTELSAWVNVPFPARDVDIVNVLLLVKITPATVIFGIVKNPEAVVSAWLFVIKVCIPLPALKLLPAPIKVIPPLKVAGEFPVLLQAAPADTVTRPVRFRAPDTLLINMLPLSPLPTVVVPLTVNGKPATVKVVPLPMVRLPPIIKLPSVAVVAVPPRLKLRLTAVPEVKVFAPLPNRLRS